MHFSDKGVTKVITFFLYATLGVFIVIVGRRYIFPALLPFAVAFIFALMTRKWVIFLCEKCRFSRIFASLLVTLSVSGAFFGGVWFLVRRLVVEFSGLVEFAAGGGFDAALTSVTDTVNRLFSRLSHAAGERLSGELLRLWQGADRVLVDVLETAIPKVIDFFVAFFGAFPRIFLFVGTLLIAFFYFASDYERIMRFIRAQLSPRVFGFVTVLKEEFFTTVFSVLRAYCILFAMTFLELWIGFSIIGVKYATLIAFLTAIVDILPVFGTGTILVPWGIFELLSQNFKNGLCILALYGIITIARQTAEPKILGNSVGLHPLVTLIPMYAGLKTGGVAGLFVFPIVVIILKNLNERGSIRLYKTPEPSSAEKRELRKKKRFSARLQKGQPMHPKEEFRHE